MMSLVLVTLLSILEISFGAILEGSISVTLNNKACSISLKVDPKGSAIVTILGDKTGDYCAIGWGESMGANPQALAAGMTNDWTNEYQVGYGGATAVTTKQCTVVTSEVNSGTQRQAVFTCALTGNYAFPTTAGDIKVIVSLGSSTAPLTTAATGIRKHASGGMSKKVLTLADPNSCAKDIFGVAPQSAASPANLGVTGGIMINCKAKQVEFTLVGSETVWLGMVFGTGMITPGNNFGVIYTETNNVPKCAEYKITQKIPSGVAFVQDMVIESNTKASGVRTVKCSLSLNKTSAFTLTTAALQYFLARGSGLPLAIHAARADTPGISVNLQTAGSPTRITIAPTTIPTRNPIAKTVNNCARDSYGLPVTQLSSPDMKVGVMINCKNNLIEFTLEGPATTWLGIVFGTGMAAPGPNFAAIYTNDGTNGKCAEYTITARSAAGIAEKQAMTIASDTLKGGRRTVVCTLDLSLTTRFDLNTGEVSFLQAHGDNSLSIAYHGANAASARFTVNLQTGATSVLDTGGWFVAHGVFMWLAWGLFANIGIFSSKNRYIFKSTAGLWFKLHWICQSICVVASFIGLLMVMIGRGIAGNPILSGSDIHEVVGAFVLIFAFLQPLNAKFRPHNPPKGVEKSQVRKVWEYVHKSLGYLCLIAAQFVAFFGFSVKLGEVGLGTGQIIWMSLVFVAFIGVWIYGCTSGKDKDEPTKPAAHSNINSNDMNTDDKDTDAHL